MLSVIRKFQLFEIIYEKWWEKNQYLLLRNIKMINTMKFRRSSRNWFQNSRRNFSKISCLQMKFTSRVLRFKFPKFHLKLSDRFYHIFNLSFIKQFKKNQNQHIYNNLFKTFNKTMINFTPCMKIKLMNCKMKSKLSNQLHRNQMIKIIIMKDYRIKSIW